MNYSRYLARFLTVIAAVALLSMAGALDGDQPPPDAIDSPEVAQELAVAAQRFMDALDPGMQAKYLFRDAERGNFHFFPIARRGVPLKQLKDGQRQLGYALLSAALSHAGNQKALTIMSLGDYLRETDKTPLASDSGKGLRAQPPDYRGGLEPGAEAVCAAVLRRWVVSIG